MLKRFLYFCGWLLSLASGGAFAQNATPAYVRGEVLVRLADKQPIEKLLAEAKKLDGGRLKLEPKQLVSKTLNAWLIGFDPNSYSHPELLERLRGLPLVLAAQNNHLLEHRATTPNDPSFNLQWQYLNNGGSGGVLDADIDAELAWDITTGGLSAMGDTIVVCVIDDGFDTSHTDFGGNIWVNYAEIPGDGIDNDQNGYVDDYRGWNIYDLNDDISNGVSGGWHGTSVAGIVGARGDNGIGVTGVNWRVKLMIVAGSSGTEAGAIAAYEYPLQQRKRWNQTGGSQGAFVVATNSSWGVNLLQAADAPLWCAFYDSLGMEGILSAGATANSNVNVDTQGDMPSSCGSPYLITVTNLDRSNTKITAAGYGTTTIDLGAFGQDAYTVDKPNIYAAFGGTSAATPHVAGAIGLLYSAPCTRLASLARLNPAQAAIQVRDAILQSTDPVPSLQGITTTGGHLNLHTSLTTLLNSGCAISGCYEPFLAEQLQRSGNDMTIAWRAVPSASRYRVRIRPQGSSVWADSLLTPDTFYFAGNLLPCAGYEFDLQSDCDTALSDPSRIFTFYTSDCCNAAHNLAISNIQDSSAQLSWNGDPVVLSYVLYYRISGTQAWDSMAVSGNGTSLSGLRSCTSYDIRLRSVCAVNAGNPWSAVFNFQTLGCGTCVDANYCPMEADDASYEWIERLQIGSWSNASGNDGGYGDYTVLNRVLQMRPGDYQQGEFQLRQSNSSANWRWRVWIDYNQDGAFDTLTEQAYDSDYLRYMADTLHTVGFFTNTTAPLGKTRMRVAMKWGNALADPCTGFYYGEVEDYCVHITYELGNETLSDIGAQARLYPNPSNGHTQLELNGLGGQTANVAVWAMDGRLAKAESVEIQNELQIVPLDLSALPAGVYAIQVRTAQGSNLVLRYRRE